MRKLLAFPLGILLVSGCISAEEKLERKAERIHSSILTVDTHCDTPISLDKANFDLGVKNDFGCVDFPRMMEGGLHSEFFAVFIEQGIRNDSTDILVHEKTLSIFSKIQNSLLSNSDKAELAMTAEDAYRIKRSGKIAAFIGLENGYAIGHDLKRIKQYYDLGARYITLSHTRNNDICDSSTDPAGPESNGLSTMGEEIVREMNRIGMMVDVSHISDAAFYDIIKVSAAPVIASHSSCRALCGNPRNMSDDMLLTLKENGGVIQICLLSNFLKTPEPNPELFEKMRILREKYGDINSLSEDSKKIAQEEFRTIQKKYEKLATVKDIVDHIDHVVQVIGIDHVGIGSDFDGGGGVEGCMDVSQVKNITIELLSRGYTKSQIEKIWGGNIMRVMRQVAELSEHAA
ncbi:MAG TPA: dipeptidase [Bacteroidales bacterium]|nr:dipeptidase [Bacteroidales bacterium]